MIRWFGSAGKTARDPLPAQAFAWLCLTIGFVVAVHAPHLPIWLSASLAVLLVLRFVQRRRRPGRAPPWLKLPLLGLLAAAVIFSYGTVFGREPGSTLAVGLLVLKALESENARDARVGVGFGCFVLMAALLFDQGLLLTLIVMLGLLPALVSLRALEPAPARTSAVASVLPVLGLLGAALPLALLAFVLVPRLGSPLWGAPSRDLARIGLSDEMSPGSMTELLTDDSPAMRVGFDAEIPPRDRWYFRGYVMSFYDGVRWRYRDLPGRSPDPLQAGHTIGYTVSLQPNHQRVLPALDVAIGASAGAQLRPARALIRRRPVDDILTYHLESALDYRLAADATPALLRGDLELPAGLNPRTRALAHSWQARYGNDHAALVRAALTLFHDGGFRYTLAPAPLGRDAVDDFLFDTREGFCEHYASAFTVLMRAAGIPSRVVTGYQGGYWNASAHYLLVRQSDAHAWSEVWLSGRGWTRVDPTAAVRPERVSLGAAAAAGDQLDWYQAGWLRGLRDRWDVVNRWWTLGVIGFDRLRQHGLLRPFGIRRVETSTLALLLAGSCLLFATIGLVWALRRAPIDPALAALRTLEGRLAACGIHRRRGEGPQHYLTRAARVLPGERERLEKAMALYLHVRYANSEPTPELLRQLRRVAREFRPRRVVK